MAELNKHYMASASALRRFDKLSDRSLVTEVQRPKNPYPEPVEGYIASASALRRFDKLSDRSSVTEA